jgi:hypothetical protein
MYPRSAPGKHRTLVEVQSTLAQHDPEQLAAGRLSAARNTRSNRNHRTSFLCDRSPGVSLWVPTQSFMMQRGGVAADRAEMLHIPSQAIDAG